MALERIDLDVLERGCNEVESWPKNTAVTNSVSTGGRTYEEYKPGVVLSIAQARAMIAELRAGRKVVEAAREVLITSGFTDLVSDESYGPTAADYPSGYTVLQVCVDNYDRQSNRE